MAALLRYHCALKEQKEISAKKEKGGWPSLTNRPVPNHKGSGWFQLERARGAGGLTKCALVLAEAMRQQELYDAALRRALGCIRAKL